MISKEELQKKVKEISPWHYCHLFPYGILTGTSAPDLMQEKLKVIIAEGGLGRPVYPKVLDLGSNSGLISMWMVDNKGSQVDAIEFGPKYYPQLELAVEVKNYRDRINPIYADIHIWPFPNQKYDIVLFLGTLHHLRPEKRLRIFKGMYKCLLPGGEIIVQTKPDLPVKTLLEKVGFLSVRQFAWMGDRCAWEAKKDAMKIDE